MPGTCTTTTIIVVGYGFSSQDNFGIFCYYLSFNTSVSVCIGKAFLFVFDPAILETLLTSSRLQVGYI